MHNSRNYKINKLKNKMFKSFAALMLVGTQATAIMSEEQRHTRALRSIHEAMELIQTGSEAHNYLHNAAVTMMMKTDAEILESHSQIVNVPIDEKRAISFKVSPTYTLDEVNSVTLKSFRKVVGYDTFDSIRQHNRNETKDPSSYYNVTISLMAKRKVDPAALTPAEVPSGAHSLASKLDKGFPYDD